MYVVRSLQGERKIHLVPDIVLYWPLLHFALSACEDECRQTFPQTYINNPARKLSVCEQQWKMGAHREPVSILVLDGDTPTSVRSRPYLCPNCSLTENMGKGSICIDTQGQ